ncbi:DNA repair protein RadA [Linum perenne]
MKFLSSLYSYRMNCLRLYFSSRGVLLNRSSESPNTFPFISTRGSLPFPFLHFRFYTNRLSVEDSPFAFDSSERERRSRNASRGSQVRRVDDQARGGFETRKSQLGRNDHEPESGFSSFVSELEEMERNRTYGGAKGSSLGDTFDENYVEDVTQEAFSGVKYESSVNRDCILDNLSSSAQQENQGGSVNNENLITGDKSRMGLPVYIHDSRGVENANKHGNEKKVGSVKGVTPGIGYTLTNKKERTKTSYVCENCGYTDGQWWGSCRSCKKFGTMRKFTEKGGGSGGKVSGMVASENIVRSWLPQQTGEVNPVSLADVNREVNHLEWRIPLRGAFGDEVARVLGGGIVPGSLVLVGGDPGVGKSTFMLQLAAIIAEGQGLEKTAPVVYVSGEESVQQIGNRADRLGIGSEDLYLYSSTDVADIIVKIQNMSPRALVVDSIQTVYLETHGSPGGIQQIGHVNKSGDIAGPRVLEHIVDVVLYLEGEKSSSHRLLRPVKNRFGSTDELGVFEMVQSGLQVVSNPSEIFLSQQHLESDVLAGVAVTVMMDGCRSFLVEIQALCVANSGVSKRHATGIKSGRGDMIIASIFLNVLGGAELTETAGDLAIAVAICTSFLECPIPNNVAFLGEVGLGGELRTVPRMEKRVHTVAKMGYQMCIVPTAAEKTLENFCYEGMKVVGCKNLKEVINTVFRPGGR